MSSHLVCIVRNKEMPLSNITLELENFLPGFQMTPVKNKMKMESYFIFLIKGNHFKVFDGTLDFPKPNWLYLVFLEIKGWAVADDKMLNFLRAEDLASETTENCSDVSRIGILHQRRNWKFRGIRYFDTCWIGICWTGLINVK